MRSLSRLLPAHTTFRSAPALPIEARPFSVLNRPPPNYPGHVPLTTVECGALAIGSAVGSLINPRRHGKFNRPSKPHHENTLQD